MSSNIKILTRANCILWCEAAQKINNALKNLETYLKRLRLESSMLSAILVICMSYDVVKLLFYKDDCTLITRPDEHLKCVE